MNTAQDAPCPLCRSNGLLKEDVIAAAGKGYLIKAHSSPGNYLIIPEDHAKSLLELPGDWWSTFVELVAKVPKLGNQYNVSVNIGKNAGQTVSHVHFWVIPRSGSGEATGKGLARLISEAK